MLTGMLYQKMEKIIKRLNLPLHMTWDDRIYHMVGDMTPLAGMPSSLAEEAKRSLECYSIPSPVLSVMLQKIEKKNQENMSAQRNPREVQNYGGFCNYEDGR